MPKQQTPPHAATLSATQMRDLALGGMKGCSQDLTTLIRDADLSTVAPIPLRSMPHLEPRQPSNVTLMGDAIHNMTPVGGIGANTALRDAEILTQSLTEVAHGSMSVVGAVEKYENRMREYANAAVGLSRRNAERASSGQRLQRQAFRVLLRLAQASPLIMRATIGKSAVAAQ